MREPIWEAAVGDAQLRLIIGAEDTLDLLDNVDGLVTVSDGTVYAATFMTVGAIDAALRRWLMSGENGHGSYFWCADLVIIPKPGVEAILAAVAQLVRSNDIEIVCTTV